MQHLRSLESLHLDHTWITIGSFDGVHLGHQSVVQSMVESAHSHAAPALVITFHPHPAVTLRGISGPFYLTSLEERAALLANLSVDYLITLPFDETLTHLTASQFIHLLQNHIGIQQLYTGFDSKIGYNRQGTPPHLTAIGQQSGFQVVTLPPLTIEGEIISSSHIRSLLSQGKVAQAAKFLGRRYAIQGEIIAGRGRGRLIGFPTANLSIPVDRLLPMRGVYATFSHLNRQTYPSVTNIGLRPTFQKDSNLSIETHILDFDEMIYHQNLQLEFVALIRAEQRFLSTHELNLQIENDIVYAKKVLADAR